MDRKLSSNGKWIVRLLLLIIAASGSWENAAVAAKNNRFTDYGAPAKVSSVFSYAAGVDREGHPVLFQARGQAPDPFFLLMTRIDTGETKQSLASQAASNYPWGMCLGSNGMLYIGTCTDGRMYEFNPKTEKLRELGRPSDTETYIWRLTEGSDGRIYGCTYGHCKLVRYDPATGKLEDLGRADPTEEYLRTVVGSKDGWIYAGVGTSRGNIVAYEIKTGRFTSLIPEEERAPGTGQVFLGTDRRCYATCQTRSGSKAFLLEHGEAIEIPRDRLPGQMPVRFADGRELVYIHDLPNTIGLKDPRTGEGSTVSFTQDPTGTSLFVLTVGPDGKVYMSSILPLYICSLDPKSGKTELLGVGCHGAEVYSFLNMGPRLWMAAYTGCAMAYYDPSKPWNVGEGPENNPRRLKSYSRYAHRPYCMSPAPDGKKILIGGIPDYGLLGGSLIVFDPDTLEIENEYRNVIQDQSIVGLCLTADGLVCGGSSIGGGGGSHPTEKEGKLFLWDYAKREKVFETVPVPGAGGVTNLVKGPDNLIYGFAGDTLLVFDPKARRVVHTEKLPYGGGPMLSGFGLAPNGKLIALLGGNIVEITPGTFTHRSLAKYEGGISAGMAIVGNTVYFGSKSHVVGFDMSGL